jgi:hypothetical protein
MTGINIRLLRELCHLVTIDFSFRLNSE